MITGEGQSVENMVDTKTTVKWFNGVCGEKNEGFREPWRLCWGKFLLTWLISKPPPLFQGFIKFIKSDS